MIDHSVALLANNFLRILNNTTTIETFVASTNWHTLHNIHLYFIMCPYVSVREIKKIQ